MLGEAQAHRLGAPQGQSCRAHGPPPGSCCHLLTAGVRWGARPGRREGSVLATTKAAAGLGWGPSPVGCVAPRHMPWSRERWALPGPGRDQCSVGRPPDPLRARQVRSHWALAGRWRRPGITCCCGRSWRPRSGQAPRCCLQPPARTPSPIACPAPPPRSQSRAGRRRWRRPVRGSGSWPSRWALGPCSIL